MSKRADGKLDRRTGAYKEAVARMAKARRALKASRAKPARSTPSPAPSADSRRSDGRLDQRTREGREMAAKMAAMRAKRGKRKSFFTWLLGG